MTNIIAHMAGPFEAPENTVQAMQMAKQNNSALQWVELDLRWNKSNFPFLMHDSTLDRTTSLTGELSDFWFGDLMMCDAADFTPWNKKNTNGTWVYPEYHGIVSNGNGGTHAKCHPPYAGEFFDVAKDLDLKILLDVKEIPTEVQAEKLLEYINKFNYSQKVIYMASPSSIQAMKLVAPSLEYMLIEYPPTNMIRESESVKEVGATGYSIPFQRLTKEKVDYYHACNLKLFTWSSDNTTIDVEANWQKAITWNVDGLITNKHVLAQQLT